jgi:hypothetical protein
MKNKIAKQIEKPIDTTCWFANPFDVNKRVFNQNGEIVKLNTPQSDDDYQFFKQLKLIADNTKNGRYTTLCPFIYECIIYGHNYRHGHLKPDEITKSLTEAINIVRVHFTKLYRNDNPEKERQDYLKITY